MDKKDTSTGQDAASMDWNKVMQEYWLPLFKSASGVFQSSEAEDHGQFNQGRTADSLPKEVVLRWQRELEEWLSLRSLPTMLAIAATPAAPTFSDVLRVNNFSRFMMSSCSFITMEP